MEQNHCYLFAEQFLELRRENESISQGLDSSSSELLRKALGGGGRKRAVGAGQPWTRVGAFLADQLSPQGLRSSSRQLAQTMLGHLREGLLLLDEMEPSQRRSPLLAGGPGIQEHNSVGPPSGFGEPFP